MILNVLCKIAFAIDVVCPAIANMVKLNREIKWKREKEIREPQLFSSVEPFTIIPCIYAPVTNLDRFIKYSSKKGVEF